MEGEEVYCPAWRLLAFKRFYFTKLLTIIGFLQPRHGNSRNTPLTKLQKFICRSTANWNSTIRPSAVRGLGVTSCCWELHPSKRRETLIGRHSGTSKKFFNLQQSLRALQNRHQQRRYISRQQNVYLGVVERFLKCCE